jgi:hypothetical protein
LETKILGLSVKLILGHSDSYKLFTKILEVGFISLLEGKLLMVEEQNNGT